MTEVIKKFSLDNLPPELVSADEIPENKSKRWMLVGPPGSGKTELYCTLPGNTLVYCFDPNAAETLRGHKHVKAYQVPPERRPFSLTTLRGASRNYVSQFDANYEPAQYSAWEETFQRHHDDGVFDLFDNIGIDSLTSMQYSLMAMVLFLNNRSARMPEQDDYGPVIHTFTMIWQSLTELAGKNIFCTAHEEFVKDDKSGVVSYMPLLYGKMRSRLPILFTDIVRTEVDDGRFLMHLLSDSRHRYGRSSIRGVTPDIDWTIEPEDWGKTDVQSIGLGGLLSGKYRAS